MKAFVTGATGFIGGRLVRRLAERGDEVVALVRSEKDAVAMRQLGVTPCLGDILDRESMREGMTGADVVFHVAAWYKVGGRDWRKAEEINVGGTRNVLELAQELQIPKIVYTSTIAVFGSTNGKVVDESYYDPGDHFLSEYDRTKWKAHYEVAVPMIQQGAPVIIVMPGAVYGPGDKSQVGEMMVRFYKGHFPVFPAPETALTFAHVDDIVEGHLLAAEKGRIGESYVLAGPVHTLRDMVQLWAEVTGRPAPLLHVPATLVKPFAPVMGALSEKVDVPPLFSQEAMNIVDATYLARSDKARRELGWQPRPVREGMEETFDWIARNTAADSPERIRTKHTVGFILAAAGLSLAVRSLLRRKR